RHESERRDDRRQGEEQRNPGCDERAEDDEEDDERYRDREKPRLLQVVQEGALDLLVDARIAELADEELRMGSLCGGHGGEDGRNLVGRVVGQAADLEIDKSCVSV